MLSGIVRDTSIQSNLIVPAVQNNKRFLMNALDNTNFGMRDDVVKFASSGIEKTGNETGASLAKIYAKVGRIKKNKLNPVPHKEVRIPRMKYLLSGTTNNFVIKIEEQIVMTETGFYQRLLLLKHNCP